MQPPITFVTVRFSGEFEYNLGPSLKSLEDSHQCIVVDNSQGLRFGTLGEALNEGIGLARHDLIALVHEDVVLPSGFAGRLARSLHVLEEADPNWGLAGAVGWDDHGRPVGHWSDPRRYRNTLIFRTIAPVDRLDEQFILFRRSRGLLPDPKLPSIHGIGWDLALQARRDGRVAYAIDAPTIHKYADAEGLVIETANDSPKIRHRSSRTFKAEKAIAGEYLHHKWGLDLNPRATAPRPHPPALDEPIVLLGRGGSGTRLLAAVADELGVFLGSERNESGDSMEMVPAVYRALLRAAQPDGDSECRSPQDIAAAAHEMCELATPPGLWGFKVPESMLAVDPIMLAFPNARFLHLVRDPTDTCLRRPHMTARPDNEVGRACLRSAYRYAGLDTADAATDPPSVRMARTTNHQVGTVLDYRDAGRLETRYLEVRFEDLIANGSAGVASIAQWLGTSVARPGVLAAAIDRRRADSRATDIPPAEVRQVREIVEPLRVRLGYGESP